MKQILNRNWFAALVCLSAAFAFPTEGHVHSSQTKSGRILLQQPAPGVLGGPARSHCLVERGAHAHDNVGKNLWTASEECPRMHSASYINRITQKNSATASEANDLALSNKARIEILEGKLTNAMEQIRLLEEMLNRAETSLRNAQFTITTHRSDFSSHRHRADEIETEPPHYEND